MDIVLRYVIYIYSDFCGFGSMVGGWLGLRLLVVFKFLEIVFMWRYFALVIKRGVLWGMRFFLSKCFCELYIRGFWGRG